MQFEVENKYPVADLEPMIPLLTRLGTEFDELIEQADVYFAHPVRDFAQTDEALRLRRVGETNLITYKGPKIDAETKTRRELELPLAEGVVLAADYSELLELLGFRAVAEVKKVRRGGRLQWQQFRVEVALDDVAGLGQFIELEIGVEQDRLKEAQSSLLELAAHLGLPRPERRSYLEMLLEGG